VHDANIPVAIGAGDAHIIVAAAAAVVPDIFINPRGPDAIAAAVVGSHVILAAVVAAAAIGGPRRALAAIFAAVPFDGLSLALASTRLVVALRDLSSFDSIRAASLPVTTTGLAIIGPLCGITALLRLGGVTGMIPVAAPLAAFRFGQGRRANRQRRRSGG
jgi:hypothetical protein